MVWHSLGTVTLNTWDWKLFSGTVIGVQEGVFKIRQNFNQGLIYPSGYFLLGWLGIDSGKYGVRKVYFDSQLDAIFTYQLPTALFSVAATRIPIAKLTKRARIDQTNLPVIELFEFF